MSSRASTRSRSTAASVRIILWQRRIASKKSGSAGRPLEPERTLLLAVLEDGIRCFQENLFAVNGKRRGLFDEAKDWLFSDDANWFCSFVSICTLLNLEPSYIRRGLREWETLERKAMHKKAQGALAVEQRLVA